MRVRRVIGGFLVAAVFAMIGLLFLPSFLIDCSWFPFAIECWFAA